MSTFYKLLEKMKNGFSFLHSYKTTITSTDDAQVAEIALKFGTGTSRATIYLHNISGSPIQNSWNTTDIKIVTKNRTVNTSVCSEAATAFTSASTATNLVFTLDPGGIISVYIPTPEGASSPQKRFKLIPDEPITEPILGISMAARTAIPYTTELTVNY